MNNQAQVELDEYIQSLADSDTTVVFTFGYTGAGKSCFLLALYRYLWKNYVVEDNRISNIEGVAYIKKMVQNLVATKRLPDSTSFGAVNEVDLKFNAGKNNYLFTFLDMAGESLKMVNPNEINKLPNQGVGTLDDKISRFLSHPDLPIVLLCFVDYDDPLRDDSLIHDFFNYLNAHYSFGFQRIGIVVSKWDKNNNKFDLLDFLSNQTPQSYQWLKAKANYPNAFPFSIGEVKKDVNNKEQQYLVDELDVRYCKEIVEWLCAVSKYSDKRNGYYFPQNGEEEMSKNVLIKSKDFLVKNQKAIIEIFKSFFLNK